MSREVVKAYSHSSLKFSLKVKVEILPNSPRYTSSCAYPWFGTSVYSTIDDKPSRQWSTATACVIYDSDVDKHRRTTNSFPNCLSRRRSIHLCSGME